MGKRALCVGINDYPGTESDLSGCLNDVRDWKGELERRGYAVDTLLDRQATRARIAGALRDLVEGARPGDSIVFTFSGHGSWIPDGDGDEPDGRDEMICPYDIEKKRYLLDDDLAGIFGRGPEGTRIYFISDSCHSGTVSRFAPPLFPGADGGRPRPRFLPPAAFLRGDRRLAGLARVALIPRALRPRYSALLAAACGDQEYSYDAVVDGRPNGIFTHVALEALKIHPGTPRIWMSEIRKRLPTAAYPQTPRLYGSEAQKDGPMF